MGRYVDMVIEQHGITGQQYNVLRILRGAGEQGLPTLEIAERMIEETPGVTRLIDRLEAKQLVTRSRSSRDRRQIYCIIAQDGLALLAALDEPVKYAADQALAGLDASELAQFISLLDRTRDHVTQQFASREPNSKRSLA
jgi:DNA-binding MarR family transcriptional regulator